MPAPWKSAVQEKILNSALGWCRPRLPSIASPRRAAGTESQASPAAASALAQSRQHCDQTVALLYCARRVLQSRGQPFFGPGEGLVGRAADGACFQRRIQGLQLQPTSRCIALIELSVNGDITSVRPEPSTLR